MKAIRIVLTAVSLFSFLITEGRAERTDIKTKSGNVFIVTYPKSLRFKTVSPEGEIPAAFTLRFPDDKGTDQLVFQVLIDKVEKEEDWKDQAAADRFITTAGSESLKHSVEKAIVPAHYKTQEGFGSYAVFTDASLATDKAPKPGDFRMMVMGVIRHGKHLILLRGYTNSVTEDYFKKANAVLENIEIAPQAGGK